MIDLHCHILPGIDDGPKSMSESVKMAVMAAEDGVTAIVATPHIIDNSTSAAKIKTSVLELNEILRKEYIPIKVYGGGEFSMSLDPELITEYTINNGKFVLVEFPHSHLPQSSLEKLFKIKSLGYIPIIAHPERNPSIIEKPDLLFELLDSNVMVQVTVGSLCGEFGIKEQHCARFLLKKGVVNILASDAHDANYRKPVLSKGFKKAVKLIGKANAMKLVYDTPQAILNG